MYASSALGFRVLEYLVILLAHVVLGVHYQVGVVAILLISAVVKFLLYRQVVFAT